MVTALPEPSRFYLGRELPSPTPPQLQVLRWGSPYPPILRGPYPPILRGLITGFLGRNDTLYSRKSISGWFSYSPLFCVELQSTLVLY